MSNVYKDIYTIEGAFNRARRVAPGLRVGQLISNVINKSIPGYSNEFEDVLFYLSDPELANHIHNYLDEIVNKQDLGENDVL